MKAVAFLKSNPSVRELFDMPLVYILSGGAFRDKFIFSKKNNVSPNDVEIIRRDAYENKYGKVI